MVVPHTLSVTPAVRAAATTTLGAILLQPDVQAALATTPGERACDIGARLGTFEARGSRQWEKDCLRAAPECSRRCPSPPPHMGLRSAAGTPTALAATSDEWWDAVTDGLADSTADVILAALAATNKLFDAAGAATRGALAMRASARRTALRVCLVMGPLMDTWRMLSSHAQVCSRRGGAFSLVQIPVCMQGAVGRSFCRVDRGAEDQRSQRAITKEDAPPSPPPRAVDQVSVVSLLGHVAAAVTQPDSHGQPGPGSGGGGDDAAGLGGSLGAALAGAVAYLAGALQSLNPAVKLEAGRVLLRMSRAGASQERGGGRGARGRIFSDATGWLQLAAGWEQGLPLAAI
jgi:hypothetical protein